MAREIVERERWNGRSLLRDASVPSRALDQTITSLEDSAHISNIICRRMHYFSRCGSGAAFRCGEGGSAEAGEGDCGAEEARSAQSVSKSKGSEAGWPVADSARRRNPFVMCSPRRWAASSGSTFLTASTIAWCSE